MTLTLSTQFSSAHFYHQPLWSTEQNQQTFGKCFSQYGHGHDYTLTVSFQNQDPKASMHLLSILKDELDHKHLNFEIAFFKNHIPTTENLAHYCLQRLKQLAPDIIISKIKLNEQPDLWVEIDSI